PTSRQAKAKQLRQRYSASLHRSLGSFRTDLHYACLGKSPSPSHRPELQEGQSPTRQLEPHRDGRTSHERAKGKLVWTPCSSELQRLASCCKRIVLHQTECGRTYGERSRSSPPNLA